MSPRRGAEGAPSMAVGVNQKEQQCGLLALAVSQTPRYFGLAELKREGTFLVSIL